MATTKAIFYTDELVKWEESLGTKMEELHMMEEKLEDVIRRNSIVEIASKVEAHQSMLDQGEKKFDSLQLEIEKQETGLRKNSTYIDDNSISVETESRQNELRRKMYEAEKEFVDKKFECSNFLSATLRM